MRISFHQWLIDTYQTRKHLDIGSTKIAAIVGRRPRIICVDGFSVSVQCSYGSYSEPIEFVELYTSMECVYPSTEEELLKPYAESNQFVDTVYPYIPVEIIEKVVEKHGGINPIKTFNNDDVLYKHYSRQSKLERILG